MRAQGNRFGITGWAIGVGWTVLVNPVMFCAPRVQDLLPVCGLELALDAYSVLLLP
jgi:hypothetical protein